MLELGLVKLAAAGDIAGLQAALDALRKAIAG